MNYTTTSPCANCPFRTDVRPYILPERVDEIEEFLIRAGFPCHKTIDYLDDDGGHETQHSLHCAGALILLEKLELPSQMMRICERIGLYDRRRLKMDAPVYDSFEELREACEMEQMRGCLK